MSELTGDHPDGKAFCAHSKGPVKATTTRLPRIPNMADFNSKAPYIQGYPVLEKVGLVGWTGGKGVER